MAMRERKKVEGNGCSEDEKPAKATEKALLER